MATRPGILFTAFEPSGDKVAASVIAHLRKRLSGLNIWALGGPQMREAGAQIIEDTSQNAVMLAGALSGAWAHRQRLRRIRRWLDRHPLSGLIPVDSPAANWSICRAVRRAQGEARIIHLVAPQLWAWGRSRTRKLRGLTDHVLCLFPFEPSWFIARGVPSTFVGHPIFDSLRDGNRACVEGDPLPDAKTKLALLPGSRRGEIQRNWPTMLQAFQCLKQKHPDLHAVVAAFDTLTANAVEQLTRSSRSSGGFPEGMSMQTACTAAVLDWCDLALVVSGTASLEVAAYHKPMVVLFNVGSLAWHFVGRWMVNTRTFAMPNLIAQWQDKKHVVPELVPHFGNPMPVTRELDHLILHPDAARHQIEALQRVTDLYVDQRFGEQACEKVIQILGPNA